jgi:hypothetical protein
VSPQGHSARAVHPSPITVSVKPALLIACAAVATAASFAPVAAAPAQTFPSHWRSATDGPVTLVNSEIVSDTTLWFVTMAPGWHVTMGPGGLLYDPRYFAESRFEAEMEFFIFPNASNEELGIFLGGRDLDGAQRSYTAFVVRRDGSTAVIRRSGTTETMVQPWTHSAAVRGPDNTGRNVLRVAMDSAGVHFLVNGTPVGTWPRADLALDGQFGFRIGRRVNAHITRLDVLHKLGPVPAGR